MIDTKPIPAEPAGSAADQPLLLALLLCDWANQTADGKTNLAGIFDRFFVPKVPHWSPPFFLYVRLARLFGPQVNVSLIIRDPNGSEAASFVATWEAPDEPDEVAFLQVLFRAAFPVAAVGVHWIEVTSNGQALGRAPLLVTALERIDDAHSHAS